MSLANKSLRIPPLNSLRFIQANTSLPIGYNTWPFDQGFFYQHIRTFFQTAVTYNQKIIPTDPITVYFDSLAPTVNFYILDSDGAILEEIDNIAPVAHFVSNTDPDFGDPYSTYLIQFTMGSYSLPDGFYYIAVKENYVGDEDPAYPGIIVSECLQLRASGFERTLLFQYNNSIIDYDIYFVADAICPNDKTLTQNLNPISFRCEADIDIDPAFHDISFEDMFYTVEKLQSVPYRVGALTIGGESGLPAWVRDKVNRILACDTIKIDGVQWYKDSNSQWSWKNAENYPMKSGTISLRNNPQVSDWIFTNAGEPVVFKYHDDGFDDQHD